MNECLLHVIRLGAIVQLGGTLTIEGRVTQVLLESFTGI